MKDDNRKRIIFISTMHRSSERIVNAIKELKNFFEIAVITAGQASRKNKYFASKNYHEYLNKNFDLIIDTPTISHKSQSGGQKLAKDIENALSKFLNKKTAGVIIDDARNQKPFIKKAYTTIKNYNKDIVVFSNPEGTKTKFNSQMINHYGIQKCDNLYFDYIFCLGDYDYNSIVSYGISSSVLLKGGIPANDMTKNYTKNTKEDFILVILNYILENPGNGYKFDTAAYRKINKSVFHKMKLMQLQKKYDKKIVFKIKHRMNEGMEEAKKYIAECVDPKLKFEVLSDVKDEIGLINSAHSVLAYGSTMVFKALQLNKPTVIFRELGNVGVYNEYPGTINLGENLDFIYERDFINKQKNFLKNNLFHSINCNSTKNYVECIIDKTNKNV
jgi:hypothetical protein